MEAPYSEVDLTGLYSVVATGGYAWWRAITRLSGNEGAPTVRLLDRPKGRFA